jgi:hypothetical protein
MFFSYTRNLDDTNEEEDQPNSIVFINGLTVQSTKAGIGNRIKEKK